MRILATIVTFTIMAYSLCWPNIINIPADYAAIQQGINASADGDTVLVDSGTYTGTGNRDLDMLGKSIHVKSAHGPDLTIINCQGSIGNAHRGFYLHNNEDSTSIIEGFTITGGFAYSRGGGIYCIDASPKIIGCNFTYNESDANGGGIYCQADNPTVIRQCLFYDNSADGKGGGLYFDSSYIILSECTITMNNSNNRGGGVCFRFSKGSITDCLIRDNSAMYGGGIGCIISDSLYFYDCVIQRNDVMTWSGFGGGLYCQNSSPSFIDCTFFENTSWYGGGISCESGSNPILINCLIHFNSAEGGGGIIAFECPSLTLISCFVNSNGAPGGSGGGLAFISTNAYLINTIVNDNHANEAGGIYVLDSEVEIYNSAVLRNSVTGYSSRGGGISSVYNSRSDLINCIVWDNYASNIPDGIYTDTSSIVYASYSDIQGGWQGLGNINAEPFFRDSNQGNFHLMSNACGDPFDSPCIDAGDPNIFDSLLDCSWGLGTTRSDMGAYGGGDSAMVGMLDNLLSLPYQYILLQNYPNPFNSSTTIEFNLPDESEIELVVYDLLGREITTLINERMQVGVHSVSYNASSLSSGIYFYKLQAGELIETKRMMLLK